MTFADPGALSVKMLVLSLVLRSALSVDINEDIIVEILILFLFHGGRSKV